MKTKSPCLASLLYFSVWKFGLHSIQAVGVGWGGQGYSIHVSSVSPRGSEALLSQTKLSTPPHPPQGPPRRDSVSRLETTVSRIFPEDLRAGCQSDLGSAIVH